MDSLRLFLTYVRLNVVNELQYRVNFWTNLLESAISLVIALGGMGVVFSHTDNLAGWRPPQLLALVGVYFLMLGFIHVFVEPSMERLLQEIRLGTLDFMLTKPRDSQFLVSIRRISLWRLVEMVAGVVILVIATVQMQLSISAAQLALFLFMLLLGGVIVYSFWLMLATTAFWFVKVDNILVIFQSAYSAGRWPVNIYPQMMRLLLTFLVPVAFAVTIPAEALVGRLSLQNFLLALALSTGMFTLARWYWRIGARRYSGASA